MSESLARRSPIFTIVIVALAILVALAMFLGFFHYLDSIGVRTAWLAFLITFVGLISLSQANSQTYLGSLLIILVGIFLFADSLGFAGSEAGWIWPLLIVVFGLLALIFKFTGRDTT